MSAEAPAATLEVGDDGIAWITLGRPGGRGNLLDAAARRRLDALLEAVEAGAADGAMRALVVRSGRPGTFVSGTGVDEVQALESAVEATHRALEGQRVLRRLERLAIPSIAALDGACLGAGAELALACAYRLASDAPHTRIGFPEIRVGIVPGFGGTVRLPRLIGAQAALSLILTGAPVDAREARRIGLVDEVFPARDFEARVRRFALERIARGRARTGARRSVAKRLLEDTAPGRRLVFARAARGRAAAGAGDPLAARRAVEAVAVGVALPLERAFERAAEIHAELVVSERARGLLHALRLGQRAEQPRGPAGEPIERAAVLGAGATGCAVAYLLLGAGIPVRLRDRRHGAAVQSAKQVLAWFDEEARGGAITPGERAARGESLTTGTGFGGFGTADLALLAVGADPGTVRAGLREIEEHTRETCLLAVVGDDLPIDALAEAGERPARLAGLRFAQPVDRLSLMEIVPGERTAPETVAALHDLGRRLGRTPLVVRPGGGLLSPLLAVLFSEALRMLEEGATVEEVDGEAEAFGWLAGPLKRVDAFGLARADRLLAHFAERPGGGVARSALLRRMVEARRTAAVSFYQYRDGKLVGAGGERRKGGGERDATVAVQDRLLFLLINEAARLLEEGEADPAGIDLASVAGLGFPRGRGGLLYHAGRLGAAEVLSRLDSLRQRLGDRFEPAPVLRRLLGPDTAPLPGTSGHRPPSLLS